MSNKRKRDADDELPARDPVETLDESVMPDWDVPMSDPGWQRNSQPIPGSHGRMADVEADVRDDFAAMPPDLPPGVNDPSWPKFRFAPEDDWPDERFDPPTHNVLKRPNESQR
jgi:hypothetical protein